MTTLRGRKDLLAIQVHRDPLATIQEMLGPRVLQLVTQVAKGHKDHRRDTRELQDHKDLLVDFRELRERKDPLEDILAPQGHKDP